MVRRRESVFFYLCDVDVLADSFLFWLVGVLLPIQKLTMLMVTCLCLCIWTFLIVVSLCLLDGKGMQNFP